MLEAWARSVPVIAAAIGPIPSLNNDGVDGYLVQAKEPVILAAALHKMASSSVSSRETLAAAAAKRTKDTYTWEKQAAKVAEIAKELL